MTTFIMVLAIILLWLIFDFVIIVIAGNNDKQDVLFDSKLLTWTVMLPLTLITMAALLAIELLTKK